MAPTTTFLVRSIMAEGEPLFATSLQQLLRHYHRDYATQLCLRLSPLGLTMFIK